METRTTLWRDIDPIRRWALVLPREHDAWGILLVSSLTGISVGTAFASNLPREMWLLAAAGALFCARTPVENALLPDDPLRPRSISELRWMSLFAAVFAAIAGVALAILFTDPLPAGFLAVGLIAAATLEAQVALKLMRRYLRVVAHGLVFAGLLFIAFRGSFQHGSQSAFRLGQSSTSPGVSRAATRGHSVS